MAFYAHTGNQADCSDWHSLGAHLEAVAQLASQFARDALPDSSLIETQARLAGWLHDLGKYRTGFQCHLRGERVERESSYHKQVGALQCANEKNLIASFAIAGHHGGIPSQQGLRELIASRHAKDGLAESLEKARENYPEIFLTRPVPPEIHNIDEAEILIRLVFSMLVDADGTDTGAFDAKIKGWAPRPLAPPLNPQEDLAQVLAFAQERALQTSHKPTRDARAQVLESCLEAATQPPGLFTLRVPTGGGKTLSGLAFALKHAALNRMRRVIMVAPYLTILEQTADVIRKATGRENQPDYLLEHHSLADMEGDPGVESFRLGRRGERWDSPLVATSNVQFWESLFSNKPGRCRKVHQMARSVILLDECQSIPASFFAPVCSMLKALASHWHSTIVLCTATQPAWGKRSGFAEGLENVREIIPKETGLFQKLRRAAVCWPKRDEWKGWEVLAGELAPEQQTLTIVNTRKAARDLVEALRAVVNVPVYHLSTGLCPAHRRKVLATVHNHLSRGESCHLVSTQVVEAGVDIDFPVVYREMAPLECILQAAGRCNREGKLNLADGTPGGRVVVFRSEKGVLPPDRWYKAGRSILETVFLAADRVPQPDDPELIEEYYRHLHASGELDGHQIQDHRARLDFPEVAERFKLIEDGGLPVVVASWSAAEKKVAELLKAAAGFKEYRTVRELDAYKVNLRQQEILKHGAWIREELPGIYVYRGPYDDILGLVQTPESDALLII